MFKMRNNANFIQRAARRLQLPLVSHAKTREPVHQAWKRSIAFGIGPWISVIALAGFGMFTWRAANAEPAPELSPGINRTVPVHAATVFGLNLSANPTVDEIRNMRLFSEPLIPTASSTAEDNRQLAEALRIFAQRTVGDDFSVLETFAVDHPQSPWNGALLFNVGLECQKTGWYSKALSAYQQSWTLMKDSSDPAVKPLADRAAGELALMYCRGGREEDVTALLSSLENRAAVGGGANLLTIANETLWQMKNQPEIAYRCGPVALSRILVAENSPQAGSLLIAESRASKKGFSLAQLADLSRQLGINWQMAFRARGGALPLPAIVHYKFGHYAAVLREENGRNLLQDPTFENNSWITSRALDAETDGYCLVPAGELPSGWRTISPAEGETVWGKGPGEPDLHHHGPPCGTSSDPCCSPPPPGPGAAAGLGDGAPPCQGMCVLAIDTFQIGLMAQDNPVGYIPPLGPPPQFIVTYNQFESDQPAGFSYSNLGQKWTFNWLAYISDNPSDPSANVSYYTDGGGAILITGFNPATQSFAPEVMSGGILTRTSPNSYQLQFLDGTTYVFAQPTATNGSSRNVFMTQVIDPQGNALQIAYDGSFRVVAVTDAIGQVTTLAYADTNDIFKITQVTDPFGRLATFSYNASNELSQIKDCIGLTSQFAYDSSGAITAMTTPYGRSTIAYAANTYTGNGIFRWLELTFPNGEKERAEYTQSSTVGIPASYPSAVIPTGMATLNGFMNDRNSYFWSRNAYPAYAANTNDYTKAKIYHWYHSADLNFSVPIWEAVKQPLENWVWYDYAGQPDSYQAGTSAQPTIVGRVLDDGTTQLRTYGYNALGNLTNSVDPVGRSITYIYASNNVDLLEVAQTTGTNNQVLLQKTYNSQHLPLTITDAAGQTTTDTYNARGQLLTTTDPLGETTTLNYGTNGYLLNVVGPLPGTNDTVGVSYDSTGRVRTLTNSDGYVLAYTYDNLDRLTNITYPDGTFDAFTFSNLDLVVVQDRLGRQTLNSYDSLQRLVARLDPLGRFTQFQYCGCGALSALIDPMGRQTTWDHDLQGRQIAKQYPDGSRVLYNYEQTTSRLYSEVDEKGQYKVYTYYEDNNLKSLNYPNAQFATPSVAFTYDASFNRRVSMSDGIGTTTWNYCPVGVLGALQVSSVNGPFANDTATYQYDALGRTTSRAINGVAEVNTYDVLGRVTNVVNALGSFSFDYDGATTRPLDDYYPNGQASHYVYFGNLGDRRLEQITHQKADNSLISSFSYAYNSYGDITNWVQQLGAVTQNWSLGYDAADQLLNVTQTGTSTSSFAETYDFGGNRLTETTNGSTRSFLYNSLNQLISDSDGMATNTAYQWDADQRLVGIIQGTNTSQFYYDGFGRRLRMVEIGGNTTNADRRFVWCDHEVCEEHNSSDAVVNRYFIQGEQQNGTGLFYTRDHLGSVRELTDGSAAVRAEYSYAPYGASTKLNGTSEANFGFTGHFRHLLSRLDLTYYRALEANQARWLSRDPIGEAGGLDLYGYVENDPINELDVDGDQCLIPKPVEKGFHIKHRTDQAKETVELAKDISETPKSTGKSAPLKAIRNLSNYGSRALGIYSKPVGVFHDWYNYLFTDDPASKFARGVAGAAKRTGEGQCQSQGIDLNDPSGQLGNH